MIKRTLYFGNPAYLSVKNEQLLISTPAQQEFSVPLEDIGIVELDNPQITITSYALDKLNQNNSVVLVCGKNHHPSGMSLPLDGNILQSKRLKQQINISEPLRKNMHKQIIQSKITNQAKLLQKTGKAFQPLKVKAENVKSGDSTNQEGSASAYYWKNLFPLNNFKREREGMYPNNFLNYGYAILRAITARAIVSAGLHPSVGLFHKNQYNAFCLADDMMEPFRIFVDEIVLAYVSEHKEEEILDKETKQMLLKLSYIDVIIENEKHPLMLGIQIMINSLNDCFSEKSKKLLCPVLKD